VAIRDLGSLIAHRNAARNLDLHPPADGIKRRPIPRNTEYGVRVKPERQKNR
jgi:hypothetical protein